jgi:N-dimethylarginine dimethylaminohydrolase
MNKVYLTAKEIDFSLDDLPGRKEPDKILMSAPDFYNVSEAINQFMTDTSGDLNKVDRGRAFRQWSDIRWHYESLGYTVSVIRAQDGLEDMVFSANQSFPFLDRKTGKPAVIMSNMRKDKRKPEVPYFHTWYRRHGYEIFYLKNCSFESNGDTLWYPGKYLILSGYGSHEHHRTDLSALHQIADIIDCPVVGIELAHKDFYHLNTTLSIIDPNICVVYKPGIGKEGYKILKKFFKHVIDVSREEAYEHFACNAFSLDGKTVLIQKTAKQTIKALKSFDKKVIPVDTSEFMKSGGSVFCMKMKVF